MAAFPVAGHRWMFREASALVAQSDTCLFVEDGSVDLKIPLARLPHLESGIKDALHAHLNHYCESLHGILISYTKLRLCSPNLALGEVPSDVQDITVHGTFCIFRPEKGRTLTGVITRVNPHHIGCLVLKTFTASLRADAGSNVSFEGLYNQGEEVKFLVDALHRDGFCRLTGILTDDLIVGHRNAQPSGTVFRNTDDVYELLLQEAAERKHQRKAAKRAAAQSTNQSINQSIDQSNHQLEIDTTSEAFSFQEPTSSTSEKKKKKKRITQSPDSGISPGCTSSSFPRSSRTSDPVSDASMSVDHVEDPETIPAGYLTYAAQVRTDVLTRYPDLNSEKIDKKIRKRWKKLPDEEKFAYAEKHDSNATLVSVATDGLGSLSSSKKHRRKRNDQEDVRSDAAKLPECESINEPPVESDIASSSKKHRKKQKMVENLAEAETQAEPEVVERVSRKRRRQDLDESVSAACETLISFSIATPESSEGKRASKRQRKEERSSAGPV
ncbi:hypothetical protein BV898_09873 [Hypsibius exemplaris]|uniref:HMG box domain-containing protein n=1 Tax=Hypsibius exemplaris TaxID=2072580 RepID=A0A1W0WL55_HYPEX|nr:hypothetical protein BV898_09873 [Hypsibius exemplaris]